MVEPLWFDRRPGTHARQDFRLPDGMSLLRQRICNVFVPRCKYPDFQIEYNDEVNVESNWADVCDRPLAFPFSELIG
jgi:hypothetical protein